MRFMQGENESSYRERLHGARCAPHDELRGGNSVLGVVTIKTVRNECVEHSMPPIGQFYRGRRDQAVDLWQENVMNLVKLAEVTLKHGDGHRGAKVSSCDEALSHFQRFL